MDDSVEQICSMMTMLRGITNAYLNASFTLYQTKIFAIQAIRARLVLSEIQSDNHKNFTYRQIQAAHIPIYFVQRNNYQYVKLTFHNISLVFILLFTLLFIVLNKLVMCTDNVFKQRLSLYIVYLNE